MVKVRTNIEPGTEWQITHALLGFVDRNFAGQIQAISIQYE
jgi:hypothetical protein